MFGPREGSEIFLDQGEDLKYDSVCWYSVEPWDSAGVSLCFHLGAFYLKDISYEDTPEGTIDGALSQFRGSSEEFIFLQQHRCALCYQIHQGIRIAVVSKAAFGVWGVFIRLKRCR